MIPSALFVHLLQHTSKGGRLSATDSDDFSGNQSTVTLDSSSSTDDTGRKIGIVGAVVGTVILIGSLAMVVFCCIQGRRHQRLTQLKAEDEEAAEAERSINNGGPVAPGEGAVDVGAAGAENKGSGVLPPAEQPADGGAKKSGSKKDTSSMHDM